jgi:hypothetical protein
MLSHENADRTFPGANVTISGLTLTDGLATDGAAVLNAGNLTLSQDLLSADVAQGVAGGGLFGDGAARRRSLWSARIRSALHHHGNEGSLPLVLKDEGRRCAALLTRSAALLTSGTRCRAASRSSRRQPGKRRSVSAIA